MYDLRTEPKRPYNAQFQAGFAETLPLLRRVHKSLPENVGLATMSKFYPGWRSLELQLTTQRVIQCPNNHRGDLSKYFAIT